MPETSAVELRVELPRAIAAELQEVQWRDPELLTWILCQAFAKSAGLDESELAELRRDLARQTPEE